MTGSRHQAQCQSWNNRGNDSARVSHFVRQSYRPAHVPVKRSISKSVCFSPSRILRRRWTDCRSLSRGIFELHARKRPVLTRTGMAADNKLRLFDAHCHLQVTAPLSTRSSRHVRPASNSDLRCMHTITWPSQQRCLPETASIHRQLEIVPLAT